MSSMCIHLSPNRIYHSQWVEDWLGLHVQAGRPLMFFWRICLTWRDPKHSISSSAVWIRERMHLSPWAWQVIYAGRFTLGGRSRRRVLLKMDVDATVWRRQTMKWNVRQLTSSTGCGPASISTPKIFIPADHPARFAKCSSLGLFSSVHHNKGHPQHCDGPYGVSQNRAREALLHHLCMYHFTTNWTVLESDGILQNRNGCKLNETLSREAKLRLVLKIDINYNNDLLTFTINSTSNSKFTIFWLSLRLHFWLSW